MLEACGCLSEELGSSGKEKQAHACLLLGLRTVQDTGMLAGLVYTPHTPLQHPRCCAQ